MSQVVVFPTQIGSIQFELPDADTAVIPGVRWGHVEAFPTPAYWACQVLAQRFRGTPVAYRLGRSLVEEVGACLLGGHGIPGHLGCAAFEHIRARGAFGERPTTEAQLAEWLTEPMQVNGRRVRYRFARQKAKYLATALPLARAAPNVRVGRELRDWLISLPGVGYKTASWVARNWLDADDVAILDIHICRFGQSVGLFSRQMTVERHYREMEARFLALSQAMGVRAAELDAVIWKEMASSPKAVRHVVAYLEAPADVVADASSNGEPAEPMAAVLN